MLVSKKASRTQCNASQTLREASRTQHYPNASRWNIGRVGSPRVGARVGHVHFMFFVLISFALDSQRKPSFQWNMGFRVCLFVVLV